MLVISVSANDDDDDDAVPAALLNIMQMCSGEYAAAGLCDIITKRE